jgi:hypothetical protein
MSEILRTGGAPFGERNCKAGAKRSARQCNSVKPLSQRVFETLSRRIHDASFRIAKGGGACQMSKSWQIIWQHCWRRNDVKANQSKGVIPLFH